MSITTVDNQLIHYELLGRGKPIIFIHGWVGSWRYWWPSMQALTTAQHRSFAFDLWGFGDSSKSPEMYSMSSYVELLDQFIERLGIARPITLVGHSLGAAVALRYTIENPDSVEKLVTVSLPVQGSDINKQLTSLTPDMVVSKLLGKANAFAEIESEIRKTDPIAMNQLASELANENFAANLVNCQRPVLMVFGEQDPLIQPPSGDYFHLQKSSNNRYYVSLDDCNHFPMLQEKAKFNRLLLDFFLSNDDLIKLAPKEYWQRRTR